jgi:hypothetical protein
MPCSKSTKSFAVTNNKVLCRLDDVADTTFQDRIDVAIARAGGQSALAEKVSRYTGKKVDPQVIQYLASRKRAKRARASRFTPAIAAVTGLRAEWLAHEKGPRDDDPPAPELTVAGEIDGMEFTKQAIEVAKAFMDLPRRRRDEIHRQVTTEALLEVSHVPDSKLGHLAAPTKKRVKGTQ